MELLLTIHHSIVNNSLLGAGISLPTYLSSFSGCPNTYW